MEENNNANLSYDNSQTVNTNNTGQIPLPNATAVLVLGILSIVFCWCIGIVGLALGIIALVLASKANKLYLLNPNQYTIASYNNLKGGKICAIIGTIISGIYFIYYVFLLCFFTALATSMPWDVLTK